MDFTTDRMYIICPLSIVDYIPTITVLYSLQDIVASSLTEGKNCIIYIGNI